jgi:sodium-dependent dicarboxylate transporter 2/3/5
VEPKVRPITRYLQIAASVVGALLAVLFVRQQTVWPQEAAYMCGILVLAAALWVTEALPLFATSLLVLALEVILLANPGEWPGLGFEEGKNPPYQQILHNAADPVLLLFFGGFLLARAAEKEGVDRAASSLLLRPFGRRPALLLLGIMGVTALFSMWMSNTATATMMMALVMPIVAQMPRGSRFRTGLVLAVPIGANLGGLGTPIASPPNAVAVGFLRKSGFAVSFFDWMTIAIPVMAVLLFLAWIVLWRMFPPEKDHVGFRPAAERLSGRAIGVMALFTATVLLWLTEPWHGLPPAITALFPAVVLTASRVLNRDDLNGISWNIIILIAGGIALGAGMQLTGLDHLMTGRLSTSLNPALLVPGLIVATIAIGTFMSNTAAANLLLPIGISATAAIGSQEAAAVGIALAASLSMSLPISTPPNAIAYASGEFQTRHLMVLGAILGLAGAALITFAVRFI